MATKDRIKSQKERARVMKEELTKIGNFIVSLESDSYESPDLNLRFW